ncbi:MAG: hypothetical protein AAF587_00645 [Bacteroidota bacterium]
MTHSTHHPYSSKRQAAATQSRQAFPRTQSAHASLQPPAFQLKASTPQIPLQRQRKPRKRMYWVPFNKDGTWDGKNILRNMSSPPVILRTAILYGPRIVMNVCRNLLKKIKENHDGKKGSASGSRSFIQIRDIFRNIHYGIQGGARAGGSSTLKTTDLEELGQWIRQMDDGHKINFNKDGSWDALSILQGLSQKEKEITRIPPGLPAAGEESDYYRCGAQSVMASAILKGPEAVLSLGKHLLLKIKAKLTSELFPPFIHTIATDQVKYVMREIARGMKSKGRGNFSHLTKEDFAYLAHWLYIYTYNPQDYSRANPVSPREVGQEDENAGYRTDTEIVDAATISGYENLNSWKKIRSQQELTSKAQALDPGDSFIVFISNKPESRDPNTYYHTILYFKDPNSEKVGVYNPNGGDVEILGNGWFEVLIDEHFEDPSYLKPLMLERSVSLPKASELPDSKFPWPTGSRVEFYDEFLSKSKK